MGDMCSVLFLYTSLLGLLIFNKSYKHLLNMSYWDFDYYPSVIFLQ